MTDALTASRDRDAQKVIITYPNSLIYRDFSMNNLRIAVFYKKNIKKVYLIKVVVSNMCCFNVDGYRICWALLYIKLCIGNHCHKYSTECKYNITLWFYNICKAGKYKGLKSHIVKKKKPIIQKNVFTDNILQT